MDTVGRWGGDEFVVIMNELDANKAASYGLAHAIAEKINIALSAPYWLAIHPDKPESERIEHYCSASIGVDIFLGDQKNPDEILKNADTAMYHAKKNGSAIRFYD